MRRQLIAVLFGIGTGVVMSSGCFGEPEQVICEDGAEGCACFANATCRDALVCIDDACVLPGEGTGGPTSTSGVSTTTASTDDDTATGSASDASSDSTGDGCAGEGSAFAMLDVDTSIASGSPNLNYGAQPLSNIGTGRALLRFVLTQPAADALLEKRVTTMALTLTRVAEGCGSECPASGGQLAAYPLRNDWEEGTNDGNDPGATWVRRYLSTEPWGMDGASEVGVDRGELAATVTVTENEDAVTLMLDPERYTSEWVIDRRISVIVEPEDGAVFVASTRENGTYAAPSLEVSYCP